MDEKRLEDYLIEDEKILWRAKAKENDILSCKMLNMFPFLILWLLAESLILGICFTHKMFGDMNVFYLILSIVAILLHLVPTGIWFMGVVKENERHRGDEYAVTNKRLIIMHSALHDSVEMVELAKVEDVELKRSLGETILSTGRVVFELEDEQIVLQSLEDAKKAYKKIYRAVNKDKENEGE